MKDSEGGFVGGGRGRTMTMTKSRADVVPFPRPMNSATDGYRQRLSVGEIIDEGIDGRVGVTEQQTKRQHGTGNRETRFRVNFENHVRSPADGENDHHCHEHVGHSSSAV